MAEEVREEDAADVKARKQAAAKAREEAELRQRSQVHCSNLLQTSVKVIPDHALCAIFVTCSLAPAGKERCCITLSCTATGVTADILMVGASAR